MNSDKRGKNRHNDEITSIIEDEILTRFSKRYVMVGNDSTTLSCLYLQYAEAIKNFEVYDDDVWVLSYPKTGTTWAQEMVWLIGNNLDFEGAKKPLKQRFPYLEFCTVVDRVKIYEALNTPALESEVNSIDFAKNMQRPRFIKTHLPFSLLPEQIRNGRKFPKMICTMRNPKDTCVSFYHHGTLTLGWRTGLENFTKVFMAERSLYGSYWKHVLGYWNQQHLPNLLIVKYEDMKSNLASVIENTALFLNKKINENQAQMLCKHLSFQSMKSNPALNGEEYVEKLRKHNLVVKDGTLIRSGIIGKYKEELSPETVIKFNKWIKRNVKGTGLEHDYIFQI